MCTKCDDSGLDIDGVCSCPHGRALDREFEAASMNVCPCCGRPGGFGGCETCAFIAEYELEYEPWNSEALV